MNDERHWLRRPTVDTGSIVVQCPRCIVTISLKIVLDGTCTNCGQLIEEKDLEKLLLSA